MPYSQALLIGVLVACGLLHVGFNLHDGAKPSLVVGALAGAAAALGLVFLMLRGRGTRERFVQTATALAVVDLLFGIVKGGLSLLLPLQAWRAQLIADPSQLPTLVGHQSTIAFLVVLFGIWQLCIWIGVLRRALEVSIAGGALVLLGLFFANVVVTVLVASIAGVA